MKNILIALVFASLLIALFIKATDRVCDKIYSKEFKQTQQYKDMQCPENK